MISPHHASDRVEPLRAATAIAVDRWRENRTLRMERDILKKATAFFAKEHP